MGRVPQILSLAITVTASLGLTRAAGLAVKVDDPFALPVNFKIGAGVSAVQTEGAWDEDGKLESAVDHVLHFGNLRPLGFGPPHAHDVAADSYHRFKEDVAMAKQLGLQIYRFSVSWVRVFSDGKRNEKGIQYYHDLIKEIRDNGMQPLVTMYHFGDHPQTYEDQFQGWQSEEMVAKFEEYAMFLFGEYGTEVDLWTTINEPNLYCTYFNKLINATSGMGERNIYDCTRNTILAHARAYRAFKAAGHSGQLGCTAILSVAKPNTTSPEDVYSAQILNEAHAGQSLAPIVLGDYPQVVKDALGNKIKEFTSAEKELIKGAADFLGFNIYFGMKTSWRNPDSPSPSVSIPIIGRWIQDLPMVNIVSDDTGDSLAYLSEIRPQVLQDAILWAWDSYKMPMLITENGFADTQNLGKHDHKRSSYHSAYLRTLVTTIKESKADVIGYCAWSLIDSFEWSAAYGRPFGLVHVDYEGKSLNRSLKDSSEFWIQLAKTRVVPLVEEPTTLAPIPSTSATPTTSPAPGITPPSISLFFLLVMAPFMTL